MSTKTYYTAKSAFMTSFVIINEKNYASF